MQRIPSVITTPLHTYECYNVRRMRLQSLMNMSHVDRFDPNLNPLNALYIIMRHPYSSTSTPIRRINLIKSPPIVIVETCQRQSEKLKSNKLRIGGFNFFYEVVTFSLVFSICAVEKGF